MKKRYIRGLILGFCTVALLFCVYLILSNIRLLGDDLWYYTFLRHGADNFFKQLSSQYIYVNGRLFVHAVLALFLAFDDLSIIKIVNFLMLFISGIFIVKLTATNKSNVYSMLLTVFSLFLMIGSYIVSDAYLWLSGSFNYVFPAMLLLIYTYLLKSSIASPQYVLIMVICGFSAITTEINSILTLAISSIYCFNCIKTKKHFKLSVAALAISLLGTATVFCSPGIVRRFFVSGDGEGIIKRLLISFTTFSQMSWEANGMSYIIMLSAITCCICSCVILKNKLLTCLNGIVAAIAATTVLGVNFSAYFYMLISALYITVLICYSIAFCNTKADNVLIVCVLFLIISTGIIFISAEATYRMLFAPAFCLLIIAVRSLALSDLSKSVLTCIVVLLCVGACYNSLNIYFANEKNSDIWDENQEKILSYSGSGTLYLKNVYDERFFQSDFQSYFLGWYLNEYGIGKDVTVERTEDKKYRLIKENGDIVSENIIKRKNDYYVYCRELADFIDAEVTWKYGTANITYNGNVYRLKAGLNSVITKNIGGASKKLSAPIRSINDKIYISVQDACSIFGLDLRIE